MLLELRLKDFVLIKEARLSFEPGFVVLTGETGAGKTLLIRGLKLLMGERASPALIRPGARQAVLEAVFRLSPEMREGLLALGLEAEGEMVVRRVISPERSRAYLNDSPVTLGLLAETVGRLVVLAGQHDYQTLSRAEEKLLLLDRYAGLLPLREKYEGVYQGLRALEKELRERQERLKRSLKEEDFLRFQLAEIEEVSPRPGEDEELEEKVKVLKNLSRLREELEASLKELDQAFSSLSRSKKALREASALSRDLAPFLTRLEGLYYETEDLLLELREKERELPAGAEELEALEERLYQLRRLKRKYGPTLEDVLAHLEGLKRELSTLSHGEEEVSRLEEELSRLRAEAEALAGELGRRRREAARRLEREVGALLPTLALEGARFRISFEEVPLSSTGRDRVDFLVATQPKAPFRPLAQVASGGELSRLFLALKAVTAREAAAQVLVFDEVDVGVGGRVAARIGALLRELSGRHQVICVTHQPQIAALASQHFFIEKKVSAEEAATSIRELSPEERVAEISRMLGGPEARELAERLLAA